MTMEKIKFQSLCYHALFSFGIVVSDLFSKFLAFNYWNNPFRVTRFFSIEVSLNRGVTWSFFSRSGKAQSIILIGIISAILLGFLFFLISELKRRKSAIPEMFIFAGGLSNLIDRVWRGGVLDFLSLNIGDWYWPTFNIADIFIFLGVALLVIKTLKEVAD